MTPPLLSYITFNRLGLTIKNLASILESTDDFEMHIIDNNSTDGTWEYLQTLDDSRISSILRIPINNGQIYANNLNLLKRRPDQYFITVDNDVFFETKDWISRFIKIFEVFPKVGLLGLPKGSPYPEYMPPVKVNSKDDVFYLELIDTSPNIEQNYIPGCCQCLRPELIDEIGFWCEESCFGDRELSARVTNFTPFKVGFVPDISIKMDQSISCNECLYKDQCKINSFTETCFTKYNIKYKNEEFFKKFKWKYDEVLKDMKSGARDAYCASCLNELNPGRILNVEWALENFKYFIDSAN